MRHRIRYRGLFYIGIQSVRQHPLRAVVLVSVISLLLILPLAVTILVSHYTDSLTLRAESSPRFLCRSGSRYDRLMETLFFDRPSGTTLEYRELDRVGEGGLAVAVPLLVAGRASGLPLVAVSSDYYEMRQLSVAEGRGPLRLGEALLGAAAANSLGLKPGDLLVTDGVNPLDIAGRYPVRLEVVGLLEPSSSPDDRAVFCSVQTGWLSAGLAHGHQELTEESESSLILKREEGNIVGSPVLTGYIEVTDKNRNSFHFHGDKEQFPLTAIFLWADSPRSNIVISSRYRGNNQLEVLNPDSVAAELKELIFDLKKIVDIVLGVTGASAAALIFLVILLSLQLRKSEFDSLFRLGASRKMLFFIASFDLTFYLVCAGVLTAPALILTRIFADQLMRAGL